MIFHGGFFYALYDFDEDGLGPSRDMDVGSCLVETGYAVETGHALSLLHTLHPYHVTGLCDGNRACLASRLGRAPTRTSWHLRSLVRKIHNCMDLYTD